MTEKAAETRNEIERIRRVADQLCTAHAYLGGRFGRLALLLDIVILLLSAWLTSVAFADTRLDNWLVPFGLDSTLWIGLLGVFTFSLTLVQLKTDWKGKAEAHRRSFGMYVEVKREAGYLLATSDQLTQREFQRLASRYDMAADVGAGVPEAEFLRMKQRHKIKVEISKVLDEKPAINIPFTKLKLFMRDNWPWPPTRKNGKR